MADSATVSSLEASLLETASRLAGAERWGDVETLGGLLDPEYQGFDPAGRPQNRASVLAAYAGGKVQISGLRLTELRAKVIGKAGLVTGVIALSGRLGVEEFDLHLRFLDVYTWNAGAWRLIASQHTRLPR